MSRYEDLKDRARETIFDNVMGEIEAPKHQKMIHDILDRLEIDVDDLYDTSDSHTEDISQLKSDVEIKLDAEQYNSDKELQKEIDENQDKRIDDNRVKISENNQEIKVIKDTLKHLNSNDEIQEAKGGSIINLPNNAMKSVVPNYRFDGMTVQNLVNNPNMKDTSYWHPIDKVEGGFAYFRGKGSPAESQANHIRNIGSEAGKGNLVYAKCYFEILEGEGLFYVGAGYQNSSVSLKSGCISFVGIDAFNRFTVAASENVYCRFKDPVFYNLTQMFGAGNEPSKEWCDANLPNYVEGNKSVQLPMRIKSVGENLFPELSNGTEGGVYDAKLSSIFSIVRSYESWAIPKVSVYKNGFKLSPPNQDYGTLPQAGYSFSNLKPNTKYLNVFDIKVEKIEKDKPFKINYFFGKQNPTEGINHSSFFETDNNGCYEKLRYEFSFIWGVENVKNIYVTDIALFEAKSEVLSAYDYIPNKESFSYINNNLELNSIITTKDYIENGKLYKNTKRYYFSKEDKWTLRDDYEGDNFRYYMTLPFDYKATGAGVKGELFCNNLTPTSNVASVLTERDSNTIALYRENASTLYLTLDKKVDNVNDVIPKGTFVDVISPKTEVINLNKSGLITANPNGTIFLEPITNVTAYYKDGLDVSSINIVEIEEFSHMVDGVYEPLDVSRVKIEDNKLTHPDAKNGLVYLVYRYDDNPVYGESTISYYNNNRVLESPNGTFFKPVFSVDDEGNISMKGEKL